MQQTGVTPEAGAQIAPGDAPLLVPPEPPRDLERAHAVRAGRAIEPPRAHAVVSVLARYLTRMVAAAGVIAVSDAIAGLVFDEPALFGASALTAGFGLMILATHRLVSMGRERLAGRVLASVVYVLGLLGAILIPHSAASSAMLPILSVVLLLPGSGRGRGAALVGVALAGSALALVLGGLPHPFPALRPPLDGIFTSATLLGVALLILAALIEFASKTMASVDELHDALEVGATTFAERTAIVASIGRLEARPTLEETAEGIVDGLRRLPDVDLAGVFVHRAGTLEVLALGTGRDFPVGPGQFLPSSRAAYLLERMGNGPWAERWANDPAYGAYGEAFSATGIVGMAYAPFYAGDELIGVLAIGTCSESQARHLLSELPAVAEFAATASLLLGPLLARRRQVVAEREVIEDIMARGAYRPVYQSIIELETGVTVGYEALTRFADGRRPDLVFEAAARVGLGVQLELRTLDAAIRAAHGLPQGTWLSLNVSPQLVVAADELADVLASRDRPVMLEITEHVPVDDYRAVRTAIDRLGPEVRVAVDDAGAGIANFSHMVELRPHLVKVDAGLIRDLDTDLARQAVVVGFVHFAARAACGILAEGIETVAERDAALSLGVTLGQGFLIARPAGVDDLASAPDVIAPAAARRRAVASNVPASNGRAQGDPSLRAPRAPRRAGGAARTRVAAAPEPGRGAAVPPG